MENEALKNVHTHSDFDFVHKIRSGINALYTKWDVAIYHTRKHALCYVLELN